MLAHTIQRTDAVCAIRYVFEITRRFAASQSVILSKTTPSSCRRTNGRDVRRDASAACFGGASQLALLTVSTR
jgi:hypothetical protein